MTREEILGEIQAIRGDLGRMASRENAQAIKRRLFTLGEKLYSEPPLYADVRIIFDTFLESTRETILSSFGTSGWDEPETVAQGLARMAAHPLPEAPGSEPPPLTDEDLAEIVWDAGQAPPDRRLASVVFGERVQRLVAEVRRLRSDEWLRAALEAFAPPLDMVGHEKRENFIRVGLDILRKHRDGKA